MIERARCGCPNSHDHQSYWDDAPSYRYEIVLCRKCGASWAYDYDDQIGNVESGTILSQSTETKR